MSCRRSMHQSGLLGSSSRIKQILSGTAWAVASCLVSTPLLAEQTTTDTGIAIPGYQPGVHKPGPVRPQPKQRRNNPYYYGFVPFYQKAPPLTVVPIVKPKPARSDFVKDELLLVYDFGLSVDEVKAITDKYKLKRKGGMAIGSLRKGVVITDTQGQSPLDLSDTINKAEKSFAASTNNYFMLAANTNSSRPGSYPLAQTGIGIAHGVSNGRGVLIGLVDTPVDLNHPTLRSSNIEQRNIVDPNTVESKAHGTSIAGILVSKNPRIGIAPEAKVLSVGAFSSVPGHPSSLRGTSTDIVSAIAYCIERKVDILNLSFTGSRDTFLENIVREAIRQNIVVVAAGGNNGRTGSTIYPALIDGVIGVTAVDKNRRLFSKADKGRFIDIAAPGVNILTTAPQGKYQVSTGTSMAAAHISGAMALLKSYDRRFTASQLNRTSTDLGQRGRDDEFGNGLVNVSEALRQLGAPIRQ